MQEAFLAYLLASGSGVPSLVQNRASWGLNTQGSMEPRISLMRVDSVPAYADDGDANITQSRVQVDCYAPTYTSAQEIARAVKARVSAAVFTQDEIEFQSIFIEDEQDSVDTYDGGRRLFRVRFDLMVWYKE